MAFKNLQTVKGFANSSSLQMWQLHEEEFDPRHQHNQCVSEVGQHQANLLTIQHYPIMPPAIIFKNMLAIFIKENQSFINQLIKTNYSIKH